MPSGRDAGRILALLFGYLGVTIWLTWPLAAELTLKLPCTDPACSFDTPYSAWVLSWLSHILTTAPWRLADANIYYPDPRALFYGPAGFGGVPYALPAYVATGSAAVATNVTLFSCATLAATALHWVVWRWTGAASAGFVAAWTLLMNRWFLWGFAASTTHLMALQYLPLIVFLAVPPLETRRQALVLLALIVIQCLTDPVYFAPAVLAPLGVLVVGRLVRRAWRPSAWRLLGVLAAVPLCLVPFMLGYVQVRMDNPGLADQTLWKLASTMTIRGWMPIDLRKLFWSSQMKHMAPPIAVGLAVIGVIAAGGLTGALRRWWGAGSGLGRPWAHAVLWVVVGTFISLAPVTLVTYPRSNGTWTRARIRLPQYLLATHTPIYELVRVPNRLGVSAMIGICLLAGLACAELALVLPALGLRGRSASLARAALAAAIAVLVYRIPPVGLGAVPRPYPLQDAPASQPDLLRQLRAGTGPVLEFPAYGPRIKIAGENAIAMYRSTAHWRPLVNGYSSYWPAGFMQRLRRTETLPDAPALRRLVCETGVRTILVNLAFLPSADHAAWLRARTGRTPGLRFIRSYPMQLLFAVTVPLPGRPGGPTCEHPAG